MKYLLVGLLTVFTALFPILANTSGSFRSLLARASPGKLFVGVAGDLKYNGTDGQISEEGGPLGQNHIFL